MIHKIYTGPRMKDEHHHIYIAPSSHLKHIVAHYTITYASEEPIECEEYHILPDASGCIIFQGERLDYWGPMTELVVLENDLQKAEDRFFIEFLPCGLYLLSGKPLSTYQNRREAFNQFDDVIGKQLQVLYDDSKTYDELVMKCNAFLEEQVKKHTIPERVFQALSLIEEMNGSISMEEVASFCSLSLRQLRRDFSTYVGVSPKEYASIVRINYIVKEVSKDELIATALRGGFFDQAHFNKIFKQILHVSPSTYIENIQDFYCELYKF